MAELPGRVNGIGGIFFYSKDPEETKRWYQKHLGIECDKYGHVFISRNADSPDQQQILQWSPMNLDTAHFHPSTAHFMVNYRVENLEKLVAQLASLGIELIGTIETYEYGRFAWIQDNEGRKIELWEPIDDALLSNNQNGES